MPIVKNYIWQVTVDLGGSKLIMTTEGQFAAAGLVADFLGHDGYKGKAVEQIDIRPLSQL